MDPLVLALKQEEGRKKALVQELEQLAGLERVTSLDARQIRRELWRVADVKGLLSRQMPHAWQLLRKLLVDRLKRRISRGT